MRALVAKGAEVNGREDTPLMLATWRGHVAVARVLQDVCHINDLSRGRRSAGSKSAGGTRWGHDLVYRGRQHDDVLCRERPRARLAQRSTTRPSLYMAYLGSGSSSGQYTVDEIVISEREPEM